MTDLDLKKICPLVTIIIFMALLPTILDHPLIIHILILVFLNILISEAWNILGGYVGQVSLGNSAFFGIGAYAAALLFLNLGISLWIGMVVGVILSVVVSVIIGYICFRLRGVFFTFATLAVAEIFKYLFIIAKDFTRGPAGIALPYKGESISGICFASKIPYYYLTLAFATLSISLVYYLSKSKMGYYFLAVREDEVVARSIGINTVRVKIIAFSLSAILNSIAGVIYLAYIRYIDPYVAFSLDISLTQVIITIFGGAGTVWGPVIASVVIVPFLEFVRTYFVMLSGINYVLYGVLLMVVTLFMPNGLVGVRGRILKWVRF